MNFIFFLRKENKLASNLWPASALGPPEPWADDPTVPQTPARLGFSLGATHGKLPVPVPCPSSSQLTCRAQGTTFQISSCLVGCCKTHWELLPFGFMILIVL